MRRAGDPYYRRLSVPTPIPIVVHDRLSAEMKDIKMKAAAAGIDEAAGARPAAAF